MEKVKDFFYDMKVEAKRIRWCVGKELAKKTVVTLLTIIFFAIFFMLIQYIIVLFDMIDFKSIIKTISNLF